MNTAADLEPALAGLPRTRLHRARYRNEPPPVRPSPPPRSPRRTDYRRWSRRCRPAPWAWPSRVGRNAPNQL